LEKGVGAAPNGACHLGGEIGEGTEQKDKQKRDAGDVEPDGMAVWSRHGVGGL
jgi:hypothetical protein